jgi:hypothetical protein
MFMMPVMMVIFLALFLLVIIRNRAGACAPPTLAGSPCNILLASTGYATA